jgi:hypothetical protein
MNAEKHAKALRILSLIYSSIHFVIFLVVAAYVMLSVAGLLLTYNNIAPIQLILAGSIALVLGLAAIAGLITAIMNVRMAQRLGMRLNASRGLVIATSIANIVSFLTGAIVVLPLGVGLGIYGLWFGCSQTGRSYLLSRAKQNTHPSFNYIPATA